MRKHRVVLDIGIEGADKWEAVFRNIDNLRADLGAGNVEVEGVIHGKAWPLMVKPEIGGAAEFHEGEEENGTGTFNERRARPLFFLLHNNNYYFGSRFTHSC